MASNREEARKNLDDEFDQIRRHLQHIHGALDKVEAAGPEDDLEKLLDDLQDEVKKVRTGGLMGHGANGHSRALREYRALKNR